MIVILEGSDGTGKSTIAKQIEKGFRFEYIHEGYTDDTEEKEARILRMLAILMTKDVKVIYDRTTLIDDFVYNFLNKKESTLTKYKSIILEILKKCKIIHLQLPEQIRRERFDERGDQYITNDQIEEINKQYQLFYKDLPNVYYVDVDNDNEKNIEKIMEVIEND